MTVEFTPAIRQAIPLLIGLAGGTGSGKTKSAMRLAKGMAAGKRFAVIDTENGRALHYADEYEFDHASLSAPFRPEVYAEAIKAADQAGYPVIVVDSTSHEHAGDGGLLDWHEEELTRMAGDDWKKREKLTFSAWIKPKAAHKRFVNVLLQTRAHVILCFRAEEKIDIVRGENGRMEVVPKRSPAKGLDGWIPIAEKNLPYEMLASFLLTAEAPGVPKPIKLEGQHRPLVPLDQQLDERVGAALAGWAAGGVQAASEGVEINVDGLVAELLSLAEVLGKHGEVAAKVNEHASLDSLDEYVTWLHVQIRNARSAVAKLEEAAA